MGDIPSIYDVFLSYAWADKPSVLKIKSTLQEKGLRVWFDEEQMRGVLAAAMADGIDSSLFFVCCLSKSYEKAKNAMKEFRYATANHKKFIAIRLEEGKRLPEIEFEVSPQLWLPYEQNSAKQLENAATYIKDEVEFLNLRFDPDTAFGQVNIGYCYDIGKGVTKSPSKAFAWYQKSAYQGNAAAQNNLGNCYYYGNGVAQNYSKAVEWYQKSADQGDDDGQNGLGNCYYFGYGVAENYSKAVEWYQKSADQGNWLGQYNLGFCYRYGMGVSINLSQAKILFKKSADQRYESAKKELAKLE
ncbi:hypothetical protein HK098_005517 [Nowakowskiella sp. JEL0407]|nr:hypothetical protein HK098_005517 [Nowakowskiella sp. JEL0407]